MMQNRYEVIKNQVSDMLDNRYRLNQCFRDLGVEIRGAVAPEHVDLLTPEAVTFLAQLSRNFDSTRQFLLRRRELRQSSLLLRDGPSVVDFLPETKHIREGNWKISPVPQDLQDRRVEITGPVSRKMVINALNSGASCFMADFEDAHCPTWENTLDGQINMRDAVNKTISVESDGKVYKLQPKTAVLIVRPRGWHLDEKHFLVDGKIMSGSLFDFGLYFFHNVKTLIKNGSGPYFYLPKMESHLEARLWNSVFKFSQDWLSIPRGTIKATVLIETIFGAFEMDEILYELKEHSSGLNCGRWDYIFSFIKKFRERPDFVLPDRGQVTMTQHFLNSYVLLLIKTCHKRGAHAMGGMAAQIPIRNDEQANREAMNKVHQDKLREVKAGHDGTWVAHPALVKIAKKVFDEHMPTPNQIHVMREDVSISAKDLLTIPKGDITEAGLRANVSAALLYMEAWLRGMGCVPIHHLMEDAATAEISRSQVWFWVRHGCAMKDGKVVTTKLVEQVIKDEVSKIKQQKDAKVYTKLNLAANMFLQMTTNQAEFPDFLTLVAYDYI